MSVGRRATHRRIPAVREVTRPLPPVAPAPGALIAGRYVLVRLLREEPQGVYRYAVADRLRGDAGAVVRLYGPPASPETDAEFVRAMGQLRGLGAPRLAPILDVGCDSRGGLFVVEGEESAEDLGALLARERLAVFEAVQLARALAEALGGLHRLGLAHGGLRPEVVLLTDGRVETLVLGDIAGRAAQRATGRHVPPSPYSAPEYDPVRPPLPTEDVYGIGALLVRLVLGSPIESGSLSRPLSELCPWAAVPRGLDELVAWFLRADPSERPRHADEAWAALNKLCAEMSGGEAGPERPTEFGRYTLVRLLARGGMGEVFLARMDPGSQVSDVGASGSRGSRSARVCVVKRIRGEHVANEKVVERFVAESRIAARMHHPNIVTVYDSGRAGEDLFIVMEYVAGKDLRDLVRRCTERRTPIPVDIALYLTREICKGLAYVHGFVLPDLAPNGLVHRDVSPHNVLLGYDGRVKIIDFGLARGGIGVPKTSVGVVVGKVGYLSPEQARGEVATPASDLYATGLVLWELLAGRPRFYGKPEKVTKELVRPRFIRVSSLRQDIPEKVDRILELALAVDPRERFRNAEAMAQAIDEALREVAREEPGRRAARLVAGAFAAEKRTEEAIVRYAVSGRPYGPEKMGAPLAPEPQQGGEGMVPTGEPTIVIDPTSNVRDFDWDAAAQRLEATGSAVEETGEATKKRGRPLGRRLGLLLALVALAAAVIVFFLVMAFGQRSP